MAPQVSKEIVYSDDMGTLAKPSFMTAGTIRMGFEIEECDPISDKEFRVLMAFVVSAAFAFGCIVNGWLI
jgi:hypothetical protein